MRQEGLHIGMVSYLKLTALKDNYTNERVNYELNGCFNTRCDLMACDGEDSKERLQGTKQG